VTWLDKMSFQQIVAILDAGSQYGKVIDRRIRELNVETHLLPLQTNADELKKYGAIIISGGPQSVYASEALKVDQDIFELGVPVLGICYGMQLMCWQAGKQVGKKSIREDGQFVIKVDAQSKLYANMEEEQQVLLTHGDTVFDIPKGFSITGYSGDLIVSIENTEKQLYGVQYHPEVDLTVNSVVIWKNFLFGIAKLEAKFTLKDRQQAAIEYIQQNVGPDRKVLVLVSGGVDSAVCAALCTKALGADRVYALHINNGFMRKQESEQVAEALKQLGLNLHVVNASQQFYAATNQFGQRLDTVVNPEEKRKIIGDTFVRVAQEEIVRLGLNVETTFLAQGTLRPDLIESANHTVSKAADVIKTHHNDTNLVRELRQRKQVIEPLADYHKDEVRQLGRDLGLPEEIVSRQPFPGPGLAIRILCSSSKPDIDESFHQTNIKLHFLLSQYQPNDNPSTLIPEELMELREDEKLMLKKLLNNRRISAHLLPVKTVGVQGDGRSYKFLCALYWDNPEADPRNPDSYYFDQPPWEDLFALAKLLPKIYHNINRVVYVFGKPFTNPICKITPTTLTQDVVWKLQEVDDDVNYILAHRGQMKRLSQVPVILFPIPFEWDGYRSVAIRTILTNDFMTGQAAVPGVDVDGEVLLSIVQRIMCIPHIARVVYDLTSKPPATTEWE
jgi:GMP synthase (glutamine-hydrolysing)